MSDRAIKIIASNRMERLFERLVEELRASMPGPFEQEWFVVQGRGMERWLNMNLAETFGVWANASFKTPMGAMEALLKLSLPGYESDRSYDPEVLTWSIMRLLESRGEETAFQPLKASLGEGEEPLRLYLLARQIARTLDRYTVYRPKLLRSWQEGSEPSEWQAILWRALVDEQGPGHRVQLMELAAKVWEQRTPAGLPRRLFVFGVSRLPPLLTHFFQSLSRVVEVTLFVLNPSREYWGDLVDEKESVRRTLRAGEGVSAEDLYLEVGNSLLASLGRHGQEFLDLLVEEGQWEQLPETPPTNSLLGQLQEDILTLRGDLVEGEDSPRVLCEDDDSLQIHVCHSRRRELEVLYDQLLRRFDRDPSLTPRDVVVMAPDIQPYAPLIDAVFHPASRERGAVFLPFSVAEQRRRVEQQICDAFLSLLQFANGRFGLVEVLALLEVEAVYRRYEMDEENVVLVRHWLEEVRVRWGRDERHREELGMPPFRENTWMAGLDRLLLGVMMPGDERTLFQGVLPYDPIEGSSTLLLGRLMDFTQALFGFSRACEEERSLPEWRDFLVSLVDSFFFEDEASERSLQFLRESLQELGEDAENARFARAVPIEVVRAWLEGALAETRNPAAFLTGAITFSNLQPLRGIPARIVCVLGLNHAEFPRNEISPGFDRVRAQPERGDYERREDDRYQFLEALLSAREALHLSYVGRNLKDNAVLAPSVVLSELSHYVQHHFVSTGTHADPLEQIRQVHPLHPFHPTYFSEGGRLFSHSASHCRAASVLEAPRISSLPLLRATLPPPDEDAKRVSLESLVSFFQHPVRHFLQERLGIRLERESAPLEETESFLLGNLDKYKLDQRLLTQARQGMPLEGLYQLARASGAWPHGRVGESAYQDKVREVRQFLATLAEVLPEEEPTRREVALRLGDMELVGALREVWDSHQLQARYAKLKGKDRIKAWLSHLVLLSLTDLSRPTTSVFVSKDKRLTMEEVVTAPMFLDALLKIYWRGLQEPLSLFPESSLEFVNSLSKKSPEEALDAARKKGWEADFGEGRDDYNRLAFGEEDPLLRDEFQTFAKDIFGPLLEFQRLQK